MKCTLNILGIFFVIFLSYPTNINAQNNVDVRFDSYSELGLPAFTEQNTLVLSSNQDNIKLIANTDLRKVENLIVRDVFIEDTLLLRICEMDIPNVRLYNLTGKIDALVSALLAMPRAMAMKLYKINIDETFAKKQWSSIKRLEISNCTVPSISEVLKRMPEIEYLSITESKIDAISFDTILSSLVYLELSDCSLSNVPSSIENCPNLECFRYYGNIFSKSDSKRLWNNKKLREIHIGDCHINQFPIELIDLPNLQILVLDGNHIENIPKGISQFKKLKYLGLGRTSYLLNKETIDSLDVPFSIGKLPD